MNKSAIINFSKSIYHIFTRTKFAFQNIGYANKTPYFPELKHKSRWRRSRENFSWGIKYNDPNVFYDVYGFDVVGKDLSNYKEYSNFFNERNDANKYGSPSSQIAILRDKYLFYLFMSRLNLPVPKVFGVVLKNQVYDINLNPVDPEEFLKDRS